MAKVQKSFSVDDEVAAVADAIVAIAKDIKAKASISQYASDLTSKLIPALGDIANLSADVKADADNRSYLAAALEQAVEAMLVAPAPGP